MEDCRIVRLYFDRDRRAISATAERYGGYCTAIAKNILGNRQDAEERVNDAYLRAWNSIPPQKPSSLSAFLGKITRNLALNRYKRETAAKRGGRQSPAVLDEIREIVSGAEDVEGEVNRRELIEAINGFLSKLSPEKRGIFVRRYYYFQDIPAIAAACKMRENSVSVTLSRTRAKLRSYLLERGFEI